MLELKSVSKKYDHRGIAGVSDINLTIHDGEIFSLLGPNGSGKTTLLKMINKEIPTETGVIKTQDKIVFFKEERYTGTPDQNVLEFLIERNELDIPREKKLQLARDFADIFEFTFQLRQNFAQLSAGQKQKIQLSAMLVSSPSLILLDEPFHHLDPFTRGEILQALFEYLRTHEISVLWVTHDLEEAFKFSDRMGVMNFGKLVQTGTPQELLSTPRDIYVAKFLGHENFVSVRKTPQGWKTPWGIFEGRFEGEEAILVIPETAWNPSSNSLGGKVLRSWSNLYGRRFLIEAQEHRFTIQTTSLKLTDSEALKLSPDLSQCFLIPL